MKISRDGAFRLYKTMNELNPKKYNKYFLFSITTNKKTLIPIVEEIQLKSMSLNDPKINSFRSEINTINKELSKEEYESEFLKIESKYIEDLRKFEIVNKDFQKWIMEEIEVDLKLIEFAHIPEEIESTVYEELFVIFMAP